MIEFLPSKALGSVCSTVEREREGGRDRRRDGEREREGERKTIEIFSNIVRSVAYHGHSYFITR